MGWRSLRNGELLNAAEQVGFDVFVTADRGIPGNRVLVGWHLAVVVLPTNRRKILLAMTGILRDAIEHVLPGECQVISDAPDERESSA